LSHALDTKVKDSVPKISVGKYFNESGTIKIPISIHVNHALVDGYDIGLFYERLEKEFRLIT
jgi:chloramphenicol O-acetyltransferase type A